MQWEFNTKTGAGSEEVTIVYEYEEDQHGTYNESIEEIWFEGRNVIGLLSDEHFKELEIEAAMKFKEHKLKLMKAKRYHNNAANAYWYYMQVAVG